MKIAVFGIGAVFALIATGVALGGYAPVYQLSFGTFAIMALAIGATFFWLYRRRATPLALGMALSWAGSAGVIGWWYVLALLDRPEGMVDNSLLFVFLATHMTGALMHFRVIGSTLGWAPGVWVLVPVAGFLLTLAATLLL